MKGKGFGRSSLGSRSAAGNGFGGAAARSTLSFSTPPPDFSRISDPNLVVSFKSLLKKSDATLVKGLEDIRTYVKAQTSGLEDAVIKAWSELYPRLAINNSRRVRELSHYVQLAILESAQSSIQPYITQMVPTWLAGTFDNDKGVAKAATAGWESLLNTNEKMTALLKKSQPYILAYAQEGLDETPESLSDERTMSPDDLKATYIRLIGNCIDMVTHLMKSLGEEDRKKYSTKYEAFFGNSEFLECTSSEDVHLRRSSMRLIGTCVFRHSSIIKANLKSISHALVSEALSSNQLGSALDFLELIKVLTARFPNFWTEPKSRKNPLVRFRTFVEKGSQRGESGYWPCLASLLAIMPQDILPSKPVILQEVLSSVRVGIKNRDEPRTNSSAAWTAYISIVRDMLLNRLSDTESQVKFVQETLLPIITNFALMPSGEVTWSVDTPARVTTLLELFSTLEYGTLRDCVHEVVIQDLVSSAKKLEEDLFSPLADDIVELRFGRWFQIVDWVYSNPEFKEYIENIQGRDDPILPVTEELIRACPKVIEGRQGKSYGAASAFSACISSTTIVKERPALIDLITAFLAKELFGLLLTPSGEYLLSTLKLLKVAGQQEAFMQIYSTTIRKVLELDPSDRQIKSIVLILLKGNDVDLALTNDLLQRFIHHHAQEALAVETGDDREPSWPVLCAAIAAKSVSAANATMITDLTITNLMYSDDAAIDRGLRALKCFSEKDSAVLVSSSERRQDLLTCLVKLSEDDMDATDPRDSAIQSLTKMIAGSDERGFAVNLIDVLRTQLTNLDKSPLSVRALGNLARRILAAVTEADLAQTVHALYPTTQDLEDMSASFHDETQSCLGACEPFGSAIFLVESGSDFIDRSTPDHPFDHKGHSIPLRVALYMCELMQATMFSLTANKAGEILVFLCIVQQCLSSQIVSGRTRGLYNQSCSHVEIFDARLRDLLFKIAENSTDWRRNSKDDVPAHDTTSILDALLETLLEKSRGTSALAFYSGLSLSHVLSIIVSCRGPNFECTETQLEGLTNKKFDAPFTTLAVLTGFGPALLSSESLKKFFKTLIGMFRDFKLGPLDSKSIGLAFQTVCLLNGCLAVYGEEDIPSHSVQLTHAVMKMISWSDGEDFSQKNCAVASEACRALTRILPALKWSAGSIWSGTLTKLCLAPWTMYGPNPPTGEAFKAPSGSELFVLCTWAVKLYSRLARLNDVEDVEAISLKNAFNDEGMQMNLRRGLLGLLEHSVDTPPDTHFDRPAFNILHESMRPELLKIPIGDIDLGRIYPLLDSNVPATQAIAFETLSRALPKLIEELTLDVVLEKQDAELPAELLSLLLTDVLEARPISADGASPVSMDKTLHGQRSVLLAWNLVIQCFALAPHQVKVGFQKSLHELDIFQRLLHFVYVTFSTPDGKMKLLSLDKESIRNYDVQDLSHPAGMVHNIRWLVAVNYFQALKFMPQMVKAWYLDFTRAGKVALQQWTQVNFTPLVLEDCIKDIRDWRGPSDEMEVTDGNSFLLKLPAKSGNTITLSYEIDDQFCTVQFVFPETYPLESIAVKSVNRVAVPEKTWISVINNISGAMRFNCGSIIDGIEVYKRNVSGFLKGHENCCICYSVISEDMKVPDKTCGTCKKVFHGKCLGQWFNSSNGNTCPMCRQPFAGPGRRG